MASVNVPRGIVKLLDSDPSESTQEQLVIALNRMACEESSRGIMIQQGCLTSCLKIDKNMVQSKLLLPVCTPDSEHYLTISSFLALLVGKGYRCAEDDS
jgi:hypothetical protein